MRFKLFFSSFFYSLVSFTLFILLLLICSFILPDFFLRPFEHFFHYVIFYFFHSSGLNAIPTPFILSTNWAENLTKQYQNCYSFSPTPNLFLINWAILALWWQAKKIDLFICYYLRVPFTKAGPTIMASSQSNRHM